MVCGYDPSFLEVKVEDFEASLGKEKKVVFGVNTPAVTRKK